MSNDNHANNVIELNNAAILQMRQNKHDEALGYLHSALSVMEKFYSNNTIDATTTSHKAKTTKSRRRRQRYTTDDDDDDNDDTLPYQSAKKRIRLTRSMMSTTKNDHQLQEEQHQPQVKKEEDKKVAVVAAAAVQEQQQQQLQQQQQIPAAQQEEENAKKMSSLIGIVCSVGLEDNDNEEEDLMTSASPTIMYDNVLTLYQRAFTFLNPENIDLTLPINKSSMTAMILFNIGLTHHRRGIQNQNQQKKQKSKPAATATAAGKKQPSTSSQQQQQDIMYAMKFYRLAHSVLDEVKGIVGIQHHLLLLMALLNQMGYIHATTYDIQQCIKCIEWLKRALASRHASILEPDDFTFFLEFVKIIPVDAFKFAPAA